MRKTKIVCTIGPAVNSEKKIKQLIQAGMNVARLNFSHGTQKDHREMIRIIRKVAASLNTPIAILQDLQGPKLRIGKIKNGAVYLKTGSEITISIKNILGNDQIISTSYQQLAHDVKSNDIILLDDGLIKLKVTAAGTDFVNCKVLEGGTLSDHKGINLPGISISQPSFTKKDQQDLLFGIEQGVDFVAMSFVRNADDVLQVKEIINEHKKDILVFAKIEKPEAINDLEKIVNVADGIMIARGDLGVELPLEKVPVLQKKIIHLCQTKGKPVITATQMLESMRQYSRPTRAEVSDVANAIFDSTDAVMLSAETATGSYPIETVKTMDRIIREAESASEKNLFRQLNIQKKTESIANAISNSACEAAEQLNARAIVAFTNSGFTARMVSKYRPATNIIAFTHSHIVQHQLNISWGVNPQRVDYIENTDEIIQRTEQVLLSKKMVKSGDVVIILLGAPIFIQGTTNLMKIHVVGE